MYVLVLDHFPGRDVLLSKLISATSHLFPGHRQLQYFLPQLCGSEPPGGEPEPLAMLDYACARRWEHVWRAAEREGKGRS